MSQLTDPAKNSPQPLPTESQGLGPKSDPLHRDFLEQDYVSEWWRLSSWAFGLLTLLTLVLVVFHFGTIEEFTRLAFVATPYWLFLACVSQAATYVCAALVWRQALKRAGHPRPAQDRSENALGKLYSWGAQQIDLEQILSLTVLTRRRPSPIADHSRLMVRLPRLRLGQLSLRCCIP
jgi:hypothetical protein